jgi:hypothetical protein
LSNSGRGVAGVLSATPLAHVVLPREPSALRLPIHLFLEHLKIGSLEKEDENVEDGEPAFVLLIGQGLVRRTFAQ